MLLSSYARRHSAICERDYWIISTSHSRSILHWSLPRRYDSLLAVCPDAITRFRDCAPWSCQFSTSLNSQSSAVERAAVNR